MDRDTDANDYLPVNLTLVFAPMLDVECMVPVHGGSEVTKTQPSPYITEGSLSSIEDSKTDMKKNEEVFSGDRSVWHCYRPYVSAKCRVRASGERFRSQQIVNPNVNHELPVGNDGESPERPINLHWDFKESDVRF